MARHDEPQGENPLARYKHATKMTDEELGERLGLAREQVQKLRSGKRGPSLATALKIQRLSEGAIPVESWGGVTA